MSSIDVVRDTQISLASAFAFVTTVLFIIGRFSSCALAPTAHYHYESTRRSRLEVEAAAFGAGIGAAGR